MPKCATDYNLANSERDKHLAKGIKTESIRKLVNSRDVAKVFNRRKSSNDRRIWAEGPLIRAFGTLYLGGSGVMPPSGEL